MSPGSLIASSLSTFVPGRKKGTAKNHRFLYMRVYVFVEALRWNALTSIHLRESRLLFFGVLKKTTS